MNTKSKSPNAYRSITIALGMKSIIIVAFLFPHESSAQIAVDTLLNGKIFVVKLEEDMGKKNKTYDDEISFRADKLKSKKMSTEEKFKSGKFKTTLDPNAATRKINFEATMKNDSGEDMVWTGSVVGDEIDGTAEWTKKDGTTRMMYNVSGALKEKKVPGQKAKPKEKE